MYNLLLNKPTNIMFNMLSLSHAYLYEVIFIMFMLKIYNVIEPINVQFIIK